VLEDLMKVLEAIALEIGTMLILMKIWRFDVSHVDQALCVCSLWINHGENKVEDCHSCCRPFCIN